MTEFDPTVHPHRRFNPLTNEYVLVSPHRTKRPWLGQTEAPQLSDLPKYDETCYLCPGNTRSGGQKNPVYTHVHTFDNDFAAILPAPSPPTPSSPHPLLTTEPVHGGCDVLIYHPRHDLTLARLSVGDIKRIVDEWIRIYHKRGSQEGIKYVQIFENKGSIMGCSNPHPHGQVWALSEIPTIPSIEIKSFEQFSQSHPPVSQAPKGPKGHPCLLCEYAHVEIHVPLQEGRVVMKNEHWVALVPWWATWPFEVLLLPYHRHIPAISDLTAEEKITFAEALSKVTIKYDNIFSCSFAYSMGMHQRPIPSLERHRSDLEVSDVAHLHLHFTPPLLRSANIRKFLVGFELMAEAQRDLTAEQAAERLRKCAEVHYLDRN
ncbi:galactose-1-phosphate uridylyltransferase [Collybia nuda]|uniref:Galactose-1-phosphate uridylyltransferase n=1 Tax=Collybia nuda TaxID=64659 RepID=A0A9P6C8Q3_9AGAR|nr:galactose-1-phosphate uridylyltransferase [Collybia nuda]